MSWWTDFEASVKADIVKLESTFAAIAAQIKPVVMIAAEELGTIALNAVATEAPKLISGQDKLANAVNTVVASVQSQGKAVLASTATTAVQTAYTLLSQQLNLPKTS